jgi:hypothetical protein
MCIAAVIAIVGAHDARYAASRLTMPVSDRSCRARILARQRRPDNCQRRAGRGMAGADPSRRGGPISAMPREDAMTEPSEPYPYPGPATTWPRPSAEGAAPPMPSEVTNAPSPRQSAGRLRKMMRRITRRP